MLWLLINILDQLLITSIEDRHFVIRNNNHAPGNSYHNPILASI